MIMYIYQIRNVINNKKYYGKTKDINKRKKRHFRDLDHNSHHCIYLQRAYNEYGKDNFVFEILFENLTEEEAEKKEYELINEDYNNNYNCSKNSTGGDLISYNPNRDSGQVFQRGFVEISKDKIPSDLIEEYGFVPEPTKRYFAQLVYNLGAGSGGGSSGGSDFTAADREKFEQLVTLIPYIDLLIGTSRIKNRD